MQKATKVQIWVIGGIAAAALTAYLLLRYFSEDGTYAVITVDNHVVSEVSLDSGAKTFVQPELPNVTFELSGDGSIRISENDCPDKICVNEGYISGKGERIICMPKKLIVEIK